MIVLPRALAIVTLVAAATLRSSAQAPIRGRVVADETGEPIRNARVALEPKEDTSPVVTDARGRFELPDAAHGSQTLRASKTGYAAVDVPPVADVEIRLPRGGVIAGRVLDSFGEPVPLMTVVAERVVRAGGRTQFRRDAAAETDDTGAYRLFGLSAGEFVVGLAGPRVMLGNTTATPTPLVPDARLLLRKYFPGTASNLLAQRIPVRAGEAVEGVNLTSDAPPAFAGVFTPAAEARSASGGAIRGHVVRPGGLPVRHARVMLSSAEYLFSPYATIADGDGRYEFGELRAGAYRIAATDTSFRTMEFGQRENGDHGEPIAVVAGAVVEDVDVSIPRGHAISGRIVDEFGEPIENANVRVERIGWSRGRQRLLSASGTASRQTDDLGRFRIFGLLPGRYVVGAVVGEPVPGWQTADLPGYLRTYFPGSTEAAAAQLVDVTDDGDALNTEFALVRGHPARVAGRVLRASGGPFDGFVWLMQSARSGAIATPPVRARTGTGGSFEFTRLAPGEYVLQAATSREDVSAEGEFGATFVTVEKDDVPNAIVRMSAGSSIAGRVTFDGPSPPDSAGSLSIQAKAVDVDLRSFADNPSAYSLAHDDLTWELRGLNGPRRLVVSGAPQGWTLEKILVNNIDVTDAAPLSFGTTDESLRDVEVVLTDRITTIAGSVRDGRDQPLMGATIVAFSSDRSRWYANSRFVQVEGTVKGAFTLNGLPAGQYYVAAIDKGATEAVVERLDDPTYLESLVAGATRVTLSEGQRATITLRLVER